MVVADSEQQMHIPTISIIVPVYKVEEYIRPCIQSIRCQTFSDFELILVDDGSPDLCGQICDEYAAKDSRIMVIHQSNQGVSAARNTALDVMRGRYVMFVDGDDIIHPQTLELLLCNLLEYTADICKGGVSRFDNASTPSLIVIDSPSITILSAEQACFELCNNQKWMNIVCCKLYVRELFDNVRFPVNMRYEDEAVLHKLLYFSKVIVEVDSALYQYRMREGSFMQESFSLQQYDKLRAFEERIRFFEEFGENEMAQLTKKQLLLFNAKYTICAKKRGLYAEAPQKFKMSIWKALSIIRNQCSDQNYEWWLNEVHPAFLRIYIFMKRIKSVFA